MIQFETERLILRTWQPKDLIPFTVLNADPIVMQHFPNILTPENAKIAFDGIQEFWKKNNFGVFAVEEKSSGKWIGFVGFNRPSWSEKPMIEMAWRLLKEFWGKGYATEAAKKCLELGFLEYGFEEIVAFAVPQNKKSLAVMEKIGLIRDESRDFSHPEIPKEHVLNWHIFYALKKEKYNDK